MEEQGRRLGTAMVGKGVVVGWRRKRVKECEVNWVDELAQTANGDE